MDSNNTEATADYYIVHIYRRSPDKDGELASLMPYDLKVAAEN